MNKKNKKVVASGPGDINKKVDAIGAAVGEIAVTVNSLALKMDGMDKRFDQVDQRFDRLEEKVDRLDVKIENEVEKLARMTAQEFTLVREEMHGMESRLKSAINGVKTEGTTVDY